MSDEVIEEQIEAEGTSRPYKSEGFVLTDDDITILKLIHDFRFVNRDHLTALTGRHSMSIYRRLSKLVGARYLTVKRRPQEKHIYALAKRGQGVLVEEGIAEPELTSDRVRIHELNEHFFKHELMLVELHIMLSLATQDSESPIRLIEWREGRELFDMVSFVERGARMQLPVRPDAFFTLEDSRRPAEANRRSFFLEADRGSETHTPFAKKPRAYWPYIEQGLHTKKYKVKSVRVITIARTEKRAENLRTLTASLVPEGARKYFVFTSLKHLSLDNPTGILGDIFLSARSSGSSVREPLIPPPTAA